MNLRRILSQAALVIGALVFSIGLQAYAASWTAPSTGFPGGNAEAPLDTGPNANVKAGGLVVNSGGALNGLLVPSGNVGIGTLTPGALLDISSPTANTSYVYLTERNTAGGEEGGIIWRGYHNGGTTLFDAVGIKRINIDDSNTASNEQRLGFFVREPVVGGGLIERMSVRENGNVDIAGAVKIGDTSTCTAGTIRFRSNDFEGCVDGTTWKSLTGSGGVPCASGSWSRSTPGTYTFTIGVDTPTCVTNLTTVQLWGGGGGGAAGTPNSGSSGGGGGGGGYGQVSNYVVTSGQAITVVVGGVGSGGYATGSTNWDDCQPGGSGYSSSFGPFTATGGGGGTSGTTDGAGGTTCNGGPGGSAGGPGVVATAGGTGGNGSYGDQQTGGNGGAGANGGAGGSGAGYGQQPGPATAPGGGGGGGFSGSGTTGTYGGDGASGKVTVSW